MRRRASGFVLVTVLLGGALPGTLAWAQSSPKAPASPASTPAATDEKKADELFLKGKALFAEGKLEEAYQTYNEAFAAKKRYDIAGNLGNVAFELGKMRDAAEYLTYCVMNFPPAGPAEVRTKLENKLNEARKQVGTLSISVADKNSQIYLDGERLFAEQAPAGPVDVFVNPGSHTIEVKRAGFKPTRRTVQASAGSRQELGLEIPYIPENTTPIRAVSSNPDSGEVLDRSGGSGAQDTQGDTNKWKRWAVGGGAVLAATGLGIGIGFTLAANNKNDSAAAALDEIQRSTLQGDPVCGVGKPSENEQSCQFIKQELGKQDVFERVAAAGYVVGGLMAAGTIVLAVWPSRPSGTATSIRAVPVIMPMYGGLIATGSF